MKSATEQAARASLAVWLVVFLFIAVAPRAASVWTPQATTSENNTLPTGLALPDNITTNLTYQTTTPTGVAAITAQTGNATETTAQPTGTAAPTPRDNTGSETNTKPTGSVAVNALTGDGSEVTAKPTGSVAITARENDGSEVNARPSGANDPNAQAVNASRTIARPDADVAPAQQLANSTIDNVKPTGAPTPNAQSVTVAAPTPLNNNEPASLLETANDAENNWYRGEFVLSILASSLIVDDGSTGAFDNIYIDLDNDGNYSEDQSVDGYDVGSIVNENEDIYLENIRVRDNFTIDGIYYKVSLHANFGTTDNIVYITSNTWATGSWNIDTDNDGTLDSLYFVMVDNNSDDNFDMIVISFNDTGFGDGDLADGKVLAGNDENLRATGGNLTVGAYNYNLTTLAKQPESTTSDAGITMDTWYYNAKPEPVENVLIDNEGSGILRNLYYCIWDPNSDGIFENVALSIDNTNFGEGNLTNKILGPNDDESLDINSADNKIQISVVYDFNVWFTSDPEGEATDFSITSVSWYTGVIIIDVDGNGNVDNYVYFVLSDDNSDGVFDTFDISSDDNAFGAGTSNDDNVYTGNDEQITAADNLRIGTGSTQQYRYEVIAPVTNPAGASPNFCLTSTCWYTGALSIDVDGDGNTDTVNFCLSDNNSDGVFDTLDISLDATYGQGVLGGDNVFTGDDERLTAADNIRIGTSLSQSYQYEVIAPVGNPIGVSTDYSVTSTSWWVGHIMIDVDGNGIVDNYVYFVLSDGNSNGIFDNLDISSDDNAFGTPTLNDDNVYTGDDERLTAADNIRIGTSLSQSYWYEVAAPVSNPAGVSPDFRLTSTRWYTCIFSIDVNDDGTADAVYFALSDNNSDGVFDNLDISGDNTYGQGTLNDNKVSTTGGVTEDERIGAAVSLFKFGNSNQFSILGPVGNPIGTAPDFRVTASFWYTGTVQMDVTGDAVLDNIYLCVLDMTSNNVIDTGEISAFNDNFGQGTLNDNLVADNLADNNDEVITFIADNIRLGPQKVRYEVNGRPNPQATDPDVWAMARTWYPGTITLHAGNTFNFVISDENTDGVFDNLVFDDNSDGSFSGDPVYNSYPASPVRLPRGSVYAYKVVWFNRNPAYADATYGAYDLVMQPLDEASPAFSSPSPAQGTTTTDPTPTISVNLSDVGTGGYTFGIESVTMQVGGVTVSPTYSGGVVSYTPTVRLLNGEVSVSVTASDYAKNSASTSWSFTENAPPGPVSNMPPTADADGPYYVREGGAVQLDGTGSSDPEGDALTYNWTITSDPTGAASLTGAGTATPTFHAPENVASVTVRLTVNDGHGGSGSGTATVTVLEKFEIESEVTIDNIEAGGSVDATVENTLVTGLKITAKNSVQNVRINVVQFAKTPSGVPAASGIPYRYIYVATENLAQQDVENVIMSFKVEKSWITGENIDVDTIVLQMYNPKTGSWENLLTERTGEGADFVYFDATSTSLSVFAVVGKTVPQPYVAAPPIWVIAIIAIVLMAVLLAVIWRYLSKSGPQSLKV